jgi:aspartate/methionine/tyrosine aminotransferase
MTTHTRGTASRLARFGESVFSRISRLASAHGAVNLGQGFPSFDAPEFVKQAGLRAIQGGANQYARAHGVPALNAAIARRFERDQGVPVDSEAQVTVTSGCTEAIVAVMLGLVDPGDEVVLVEPFYDSYPAAVAMAGGVVRSVRLQPPDFRLPVEDLRAAVTPRTRLILINSPHNPTGRVLDTAEQEAVAGIARAAGCLVVSDEVYEHIWYERPHRSIAALPGMADRVIVLSSLGKTFSVTGWKIGWAIAPPHLTAAIRAAHQFITFCSATPFELAAAEALEAGPAYFEELRSAYGKRRDAMLGALRGAGLQPCVPEGSYFALADISDLGTDEAVCERLIREVGVAAIPCSPFYLPEAPERRLVRFAFCKDLDTIREAGRRLKAGLGAIASDPGSC